MALTKRTRPGTTARHSQQLRQKYRTAVFLLAQAATDAQSQFPCRQYRQNTYRLCQLPSFHAKRLTPTGRLANITVVDTPAKAFPKQNKLATLKN